MSCLSLRAGCHGSQRDDSASSTWKSDELSFMQLHLSILKEHLSLYDVYYIYSCGSHKGYNGTPCSVDLDIGSAVSTETPLEDLRYV